MFTVKQYGLFISVLKITDSFYFAYYIHFCLGTVEIAAVGVSIAILNQALRITVSPLVSITTSFVAEEYAIERLAKEVQKNKETENVKAEDVIPDSLEKGYSATNSGNIEAKSDNATLSDLTLSCKTTVTQSPNVEYSVLNKSKITSKEQRIDVETNAVVKQVDTPVKRYIPSASTSLIMGLAVGILQTVFLISLAKPLLRIMGVKSVSNSLVSRHIR